ncbi:MAG: alpha-L-arabinofuranosidase C-terminal domain-containing protein [bacterium]
MLSSLLNYLIIIIVVLFIASCTQKPSKTFHDDSTSFNATIKVTGRILNSVKPLIFGDNIEWVNNGMGIWLSKEGIFDDKLVEEICKAGITHLRYPGGTLSDYFEWYKSIGKDRQLIVNPFNDMKEEYPYFGVEEFMLLCRKLDIPGTITLNAGTGKIEDAIKWVEYFNSKNFDVTAYAVGNEIYMEKPKSPIAKTAQQYIDFYTKCWEGIKKLSPDIKLGAIGLHDTGAISLSQNHDWMPNILTYIGDKIDFIDIHNGYAPVTRSVGISKKRYQDDDFAECFMGASVYVQENIEQTKRDLKIYAPKGGENIEIHITEYGPLVYPIDKKRAVEDLSWNRSLAGSLYLACLFNVFLKEPKITSANHLPLCQDIFSALIGIRGVYPERKSWRNIVYYVFQAYASMSGRDVMEVEIQSPTYSSQSMGIVPKLENIPYIDAGAYKSKDKLAAFLINRSVKNDSNVEIFPGMGQFIIERITVLTADSYKSENTPEEPDKVVPIVKELDKYIYQYSCNIPLPKHSLIIVEFAEAK